MGQGSGYMRLALYWTSLLVRLCVEGSVHSGHLLRRRRRDGNCSITTGWSSVNQRSHWHIVEATVAIFASCRYHTTARRDVWCSIN